MPYSLPMKFKMTKRDVLKKARKIFQEERITSKIFHYKSGGVALPLNSYVEIGTKGYTAEELASVICHEIAHIHNYRNRKFIRYHRFGFNTSITQKLIKMRLQIGLRAELYTDRVAEKLMKSYYPDMGFIGNYSTEEQKNWHRIRISNQMVKVLKEA